MLFRNRNLLKLPVNVNIEAVKVIAVLDEGNGGTTELFSIERVLSGLKVLLFWIDWLDDGSDHSEMLLENVLVVFEVLIETDIVSVLV